MKAGRMSRKAAAEYLDVSVSGMLKIILFLSLAACANMSPEEAVVWERAFTNINQSMRDYQQQNKTCYTNKIGDTYQTRCY